MMNNFSWFVSFEPFVEKGVVKSVGPQPLKAVGHGTIEVENYTNDNVTQFELRDVLYIPDLSKYLFLVLTVHDRNLGSKLSQMNHMQFCNQKSSHLYGYGSLYLASFHVVRPENMCINVVETNIIESDKIVQLYHKRWGHMNKRHVRMKLQNEMRIRV